MKTLLINLFLVAIGPIILLFFIELGFRLHAYWTISGTGSLAQQLEVSANSDPVREVGTQKIGGLIRASKFPSVVYELKPNISGDFQGQPLQVNSFGMRDREYSPKKPKNTIRIAGIGDSVMFGWGVREDECYMSLIEQHFAKLTDNGSFEHQVEVLNFAVPGYNTAMEVATFEHKVLAFSPDLIIIHVVDNDFDVPMFMKQPINPFSTQSLFIDFMLNRVSGLEDGSLLFSSLKNLTSNDRYKVLEQYKDTVGEPGVRRALLRLFELSSSRSVPVIVVMGGAGGRMKKIVRTQAKIHDFHLIEVKPFVDRYIRENKLEDTKAARRQLLWVSSTDNHPNKLGHSIFAEAILDKISTIPLDILPK